MDALQSDVPPTMIICWFISNSCEALIGAGCVRYLIDRPVRFNCLGNVGILFSSLITGRRFVLAGLANPIYL
jgi:hypothetical protein